MTRVEWKGGDLVLQIQKDGRCLLFEEKMGGEREEKEILEWRKRIGWEKARLKGFGRSVY